MFRNFLVMLAVISFVGCASPQARFAELSAPHVGCAQEEITILSITGTNQHASYSAICPDSREWFCASEGRAFGEPVTTCRRVGDEDEDVASAPTGPRPLNGEWVDVEFDVCPLRGKLPGPVLSQPVPGMEEGKKGLTQFASLEERSLSLSCAEIEKVADASAEQVLQGAANGLVASVQGSLESFEMMPKENAATALVRLPNNGGIIVSRIYYREGWLFTAMAMPRNAFPGSALVKFFGSVKIE